MGLTKPTIDAQAGFALCILRVSGFLGTGALRGPAIGASRS